MSDIDPIDAPKPAGEKKTFSTSIKFNRGFWENLTSYEKRRRKEISRNQHLTAYIKHNLLSTLHSDLEKEVEEYRKELQEKLSKQSTERNDLIKQQPSEIFRRTDIPPQEKLISVFYNQNRPERTRFYVVANLSSEEHEVLTLVPDMPGIEWQELQQKIQEREAQLEYPLGEAIDPQYRIVTPRLKRVLGTLNPSLSINLSRFITNKPIDAFGLPFEQTEKELQNSFKTNAIFLTGAYSQFANLNDTLFRTRFLSTKGFTLHTTWHNNPYKYFMFSSQSYFKRQ